jgi:hypothetical protein
VNVQYGNWRLKGVFDEPNWLNLEDYLPHVGLGSVHNVVAGCRPISSLFRLDNESVVLKDWDEVRHLMRNSKLLPFLSPASPLFPSFPMNEKQWTIMMQYCKNVIQDGFYKFCYRCKIRSDSDVLISTLFYSTYINNMEWNRFIVQMCGGYIDEVNVKKLSCSDTWASLFRNPLHKVETRCSFCLGISAKISNRVDDLGPYIVTSNDLSAPVVVAPEDIVPFYPRLFRHPDRELRCVWKCQVLGNMSGHSSTYLSKYAFYKEVKTLLAEEDLDVISYFHFTEGEEEHNSVRGWHTHVCYSSKEKIYIENPTRKQRLPMRWCDYVILSTTFKIVHKLVRLYNQGEVFMSKFTELPHPIDEVIDQIGYDSDSANIAQACLALQGYILRTACIPSDIVKPVSRGKMFHDPRRLWKCLFNFLIRWNYRGEDHTPLKNGVVTIHPEWIKTAGLDPSDLPYPSWTC